MVCTVPYLAGAHSITFLEREDGAKLKSLEMVGVGGTNCVFGLPPKTTTATPTTDPTVGKLHQRLSELEEGKTKDVVTALEATVLKLQGDIDKMQAAMDAKLQLLANAADKQAADTNGRVASLEQALTLAVRDAVQFADATDATPASCPVDGARTSTSDCSPEVGSTGEDVYMKASKGRALVTTGQCTNLDVCKLGQALKAVLAGLSGGD